MFSDFLLISTDRSELNIVTEKFATKKAAHEAMLKEILDQSDYASVEELVDAANVGEAGYSDDEAWIHHSSSDTIVWRIVEV